MPCNRCSELPKIKFSDCDVYLQVPTKHHISPVENVLQKMSVSYKFRESYFLFHVESFEVFIEALIQYGFNPLAQKDIKLMPIDDGMSFDFRNLVNLKSLEAWKDMYESKDLLEILKKGSLKTYFQPIIHVKDERVYGYEALTRGVKSDGSLINPFTLFEKARKLDLIFFLDRLCRETIIKKASELNITEKIFINFLPTAIYDPRKCLKTTDEAVKKSDLDPDQITFEVVESEYIDDFSHLNYILDYYKEKGYSTALDDMGSGYANKESLKALKPDYMKIDMDIIQGIHKNPKNQKILSEYLKLAHDKAIMALAEGVETKEELDYVMSQGIDLVQGYYFSKPKEKLTSLNLSELIK